MRAVYKCDGENNMIIHDGNIFTEDGTFLKGTIYVAGEKIEKVNILSSDDQFGGKNDEMVIDAKQLYVLPGFVDIHMHGAMGIDFCIAGKNELEILEEYQAKNGITTIFPATMTLSEDDLGHIMENVAKYSKNSMGVISGITMEGPFLSFKKRGAQDERYIRKPDASIFRALQEKSGNMISQIAVAPEEEGALEFIESVSKEMVVSVAHSTADYDMAKRAFEKGATHVTHLFNGMEPFLHRAPGIVGAAYDTRDVFVELICDGVHIHPSVVRAMFKLFGSERICMISDSLSATGMEDGEYSLGGQNVLKSGNMATLLDGTIAGSVSNLYECFVKVVKEMGVSLEEAVLSCTKTPAKSLNVDNKCGILKEGRNADILILDNDLNIKYVIKNGRLI